MIANAKYGYSEEHGASTTTETLASYGARLSLRLTVDRRWSGFPLRWMAGWLDGRKVTTATALEIERDWIECSRMDGRICKEPAMRRTKCPLALPGVDSKTTSE